MRGPARADKSCTGPPGPVAFHRHWAYFDEATGRCVHEAVRPMRWLRALRMAEALNWAWLGNMWAQWNACAPSGVVALDVTHFHYPLGDFVWAHFDADLRELSFPERRHFLTVDSRSGDILGNVITGRPVRPMDAYPHWAVVDVTGLGLENDGLWVHGVINLDTFEVSRRQDRLLEAASVDLNLFDPALVKEAELIEV